MKYINAAEVLPKDLLKELQKHVNGELIYVPNITCHKRWGEKNGSKHYFDARNKSIKSKYQNGESIEELSEEYGLAYDTIRKIVYSNVYNK